MVRTGGVSRRSDMLIEIGAKVVVVGRREKEGSESALLFFGRLSRKREARRREARSERSEVGKDSPAEEGGLERSLDEGIHRSLR